MTIHTKQTEITEYRLDGTKNIYPTKVYADDLQEIAARFLRSGYQEVEHITMYGISDVETPVGYNLDGLIKINTGRDKLFRFTAAYVNLNDEMLLTVTISYVV